MSVVSKPALIGTLAVREGQTRFAGGAIGPFWAYITPFAWIAFVVILFRVLNRTPPIFVPAEIFVATGILPYLVFRQTITSLSRTVAANRNLCYIRPISAHDLLAACALREGLNMVLTAILIFGGLSLVFGIRGPIDPGGVVLALGLTWLLACGLGRFISALALMSDSFSRVVPILLRPVFWLSGIFYTATELPQAVQDILWYSPLFHITELTREGYFLGYTSPLATVWYPVLVAVLFYVIAAPLERFVIRQKRARYRL